MATSSSHQRPADFSLYNYLAVSHGPRASTAVLGGSATPSLSLNDIISLSDDPDISRTAFTTALVATPLGLASDRGSKHLRANIALTYDGSTGITADNIIVANATTGSNHIVHRSLLRPGDHVIIQYPIYGPLIEEPRDIGCEISYLRLDPANNWSFDLGELQSLIRPHKTKMIILNNPVNPTGTHVGTDTQREIIKIARQHNLYVHCDEIFRPLYHTTTKSDIPASMVEYPDLKYDRVITTSSLSKCYGLSGIRIGWIATRSPELLAKFVNYRMYSVQALSMLDEVVATEVLSPRCRPSILQKHLALAKHNLNLIEAFVDKHEIQCEWTRPTAGAVAFVKFKNAQSGEPVDDMDFCERLVESKGVLLSPATLCFEFDEAVPPADDALKMKAAEGLEEFKGRVRLHFTCNTEVLEKGLRGLAEFLEEEVSL